MSDEESLEEKIAAIGKRTKSMLSDFHVLLKSGDFKGIYVPEFIQFETMWSLGSILTGTTYYIMKGQ